MKNNIRIERAIMRMTQQPWAERMGVSRQTINAIEGENTFLLRFCYSQ